MFPCSPPNPLVLDPATGCTGGANSSRPCRFACRAQYAASVALLDDVVGNVTAAMLGRGMWDGTLMIFSSDNGGPETLRSNAANNYPQRGGKFGPLEGGIRVAAFVSGGYLPGSARGTQCDGMISVADWYGTRTSPIYPNSSSLLPHRDAGTVRVNCSAGCLFDVTLDPEERRDLAASAPKLVAELWAQLRTLKRGYFQNHDPASPCLESDWRPGWWGSSCACFVAAHLHGDNASGPWLGPYAK